MDFVDPLALAREPAAEFDRSSGPRGVAALLTPPARSTRRVLADVDALGVTAVHPHHSSLQSARSVGRLLDHGLVVRTWTVNSRRLAERLLRYGVSTIVTDDPRRIATPAPADR
ncbi:MAG: glycerophosphodiester phosphodiesterase family protein [Actinomycetota bacterium]